MENVSFRVAESEFVYIIGKVGSGKSSLIKSLYGELPIDKSTNGAANVLNTDMKRLKRRQLPTLRRQLGIVFQDFQLLNGITAAENLDFVLRATGWRKRAERKQRIDELMELVGLEDKKDCYPHELSGGEQQRVCIARSLLNNPKLILADEPTGNLDTETGKKIVELLRSVCEKGTAVVMITHNLTLLQQFPGIVYRCADGAISEVTHEFNYPIEI